MLYASFVSRVRLRNIRRWQLAALSSFAAGIGIMAVLVVLGFLSPKAGRLHLLEIHFASVLGQTVEVRSFELRDLPVRATYADSVYAWITKYRALIRNKARGRRVNAVAVAGVIAYEAIENPIPQQLQHFVRFSGPGKVHYKQWFTREGDPVAREVEIAGFLPRRTVSQREQVLRSPSGAITYIAAIMDAYADIAFRGGHPIRCRPALLATFFNGWDLSSAQQFFATQHRRSLRSSAVGVWVAKRNKDLRKALGIGPHECRLQG